jgi:hypothetical protein
MKGKISVTVQREDRLKAINSLSRAIEKVADALITPVRVTIEGCTVKGAEVGMNIDTAEDVTKTEIKEIKKDA